jgi:hypothetical protein
MATPSYKADSVNEFIDSQLKLMGGNPKGRVGSIEADECALCILPAKSFRGTNDETEYAISGMCQECQDDTFRVPWDTDERNISWAKAMLAPLKAQAMWGCDWGIYNVDKEAKTLTLTNLAPFDSDGESDEAWVIDMLHKTKKTFAEIGYAVDHQEYYKKFR